MLRPYARVNHGFRSGLGIEAAMNDINDDIVEVCDALEILNGNKRNARPRALVAQDAIAAWERVDKILYEHFAKATLEEIGIEPATKLLKTPHGKSKR